MITFRNQKATFCNSKWQFSSCIWLTIWLSRLATPTTVAKATEGEAPRSQLWSLAATFPQQAEEHPQNSGRLRRPPCAYLPVNGPTRAPWGVFQASQTLRRLFTDTWDWHFFLWITNRNQREIFCTYFCNKAIVPLKKNESVHEFLSQREPPPPPSRRRKTENKTNPNTRTTRRTVFRQISWDIFWKQIFKERVETKNRNKEEPPWQLLHWMTPAVILKIVFNLCLCSFFKEHGTEQQKPQQLQYQRWGFLTPFVSVHYLLLPG